MAVYPLPTVQRGHEACVVVVATAVYINGAAYTAMYGDSSLGHSQTYWLYMDGVKGEWAVQAFPNNTGGILPWILSRRNSP